MITLCRSCGAPDLLPILSLGHTPLANGLLTADQLAAPEPTFPLDLVFCPRCALVQITETVPPEQLFGEYLYFSSFSDAMVRHAQELAEGLIAGRNLGPHSLVVEIASNDGYLLQFYARQGIPVLGIEPAINIAAAAEARGVRTLCRFFGRDLGAELAATGSRADVIHANNVLAHVADLNGVAAGIVALLAPEGVAVIEVPYVKDMIDHVEFDTIYHEHLCYFSLTALRRLFAPHGLALADVQRIPLHGGSLLLTLAHAASAAAHDLVGLGRVAALLAQEQAWVDTAAFYQGFGARVELLKAYLLALLARLKSEGQHIAVYGASAKGSTLLNYFGIGAETLDFVADRSTVKQGRFTPGTHLPIVAPAHLLEAQPAYTLLLTWNFADEILAQQAEYLRRGGKFIIPIPELRIAP